jgi:hypothetical protein
MDLEKRKKKKEKSKPYERVIGFCYALSAAGIVVALPVPTESQSESLGRLPAES